MKLMSRVMLNLLISTIAFSSFAQGDRFEKLGEIKDWIVGNKKEIGIGIGSFVAGALLTYLATNKAVKARVGKASTATCKFTKAKAQALINYWRSLSKGKKIAIGAGVVGTGAIAADIYFEGPASSFVKNQLQKGAKPS